MLQISVMLITSVVFKFPVHKYVCVGLRGILHSCIPSNNVDRAYNCAMRRSTKQSVSTLSDCIEYMGVFYSPPNSASRLQQGLKQKLGSLRRSPKRTASDSSTATVTSFTFAGVRGQGEDCDDGRGAKHKRKALFLNPDTVSLDSMSVSSLSEFSECPTTGTDETPERGLCSPLAEMENERGLEPVDYFDGHPQDAESVFTSLPDSPSQPPPLSIGSYATVDSGIIMPESVQSSVFTSIGSSTAEQLPALILPPDRGCGMADGCSRVHKPNQNGLEPTEEPDFEKSIELDGDSALEQERREQKLHGSWYRKKSAVFTPESDSEDDAEPNHSTGDLHPDSCAENILTGYSKIAILGSIKKKPATSSPPEQTTELHTTDSAEDVSRLDRADTITNSNAQAEDPLSTECSPVLPHRHQPTDTHSTTASSSGGDATETPPVSSTDLIEQSDRADLEPAWLQHSDVAIGDPQIPKPITKQRSFSSPRIKKKPKPLPRKFQRKLHSLDNLGDAPSSSRETDFLSSLPPSFKPTPASRGSREQVHQLTEEEEGKEQDLVSSLPADFLLAPAAPDADSPCTAATEDHAEIITKPKSVSSPPVPPPKMTPVPPPRTKRKSKFRKMSQESSSSNSASSLSNSPIKEAASHGGTSGDVRTGSQSDVTDVMIESPDGGPSSHDRLCDSNHTASPDLPKESHDSSEGGSPDLPKGSSNECLSPGSEDPLQRNPLWRQSISSSLELPLLSLPGVGEDETRLSKVSMEVNR